MSMDFLEKLAAEVEKDDGDKKPESKGDKPDDKQSGKPGKKSPFPPKKEGGDKQPDGKENTPKQGDDTGKEKGDKPKEGSDFKKAVVPEVAEGASSGVPADQSAEGPVAGAGSHTAVIDFFAQNPTPSDQDFEGFAASAGLDVKQAEAIAYVLAGKYVMLLRGGASSGQVPEGMDPNELDAGVEIEYEHTADSATAKKIAIDHLTEDPQYYTHLQQMVLQYSNDPNDQAIAAQPQNTSANANKTNDNTATISMQKGPDGQHDIGDGGASIRS